MQSNKYSELLRNEQAKAAQFASLSEQTKAALVQAQNENAHLKQALERERQERVKLSNDLNAQLGVERSKLEQQEKSISQLLDDKEKAYSVQVAKLKAYLSKVEGKYIFSCATLLFCFNFLFLGEYEAKLRDEVLQRENMSIQRAQQFEAQSHKGQELEKQLQAQRSTFQERENRLKQAYEQKLQESEREKKAKEAEYVRAHQIYQEQAKQKVLS